MKSLARLFSSGVLLCGTPLTVSVQADEMLVADCLGHSVHRYDENGQWLGDFVPPGGGGLQFSHSITWGPDLNDDGEKDLYVASQANARVIRYDGLTGAFIDVFVPRGRGGIIAAAGIIFISTGSARDPEWICDGDVDGDVDGDGQINYDSARSCF